MNPSAPSADTIRKNYAQRLQACIFCSHCTLYRRLVFVGPSEGKKPKSLFGTTLLKCSSTLLFIMIFCGVNCLTSLLHIVMLSFNQLKKSFVVVMEFTPFLLILHVIKIVSCRRKKKLPNTKTTMVQYLHEFD